MENALLIGIGHTTVERKDVTTAGAAVFEFAAQFVNVALAGQEDEDVAFVVVIDDFVNQFGGGFDEGQVASVFEHLFDRAVVGIHGKHTAGDFDDGGTVKSFGKTLGVDRR